MLPNKKFLTQLAEFEIAEGKGCSVMHHKEFRFYEFNIIKATNPEYRDSNGLYSTVTRLYSKHPAGGEDDD